ncbi:MAG: hypothetical protein U1E62_18220 [Alsobacter sp.]
MNEARLLAVATEIEARGRINFADVRRLERDILPDGVTSRAEAEILIRLDRDVPRADRTWNAWFVAALVDFVVWSERPTAVVDEDAAAWLSAALDEPTPCRNARRLIAAIVAEAERVHESLGSRGEDDEAVEIIVDKSGLAAAAA